MGVIKKKYGKKIRAESEQDQINTQQNHNEGIEDARACDLYIIRP